jgi:hypothetical protein
MSKEPLCITRQGNSPESLARSLFQNEPYRAKNPPRCLPSGPPAWRNPIPGPSRTPVFIGFPPERGVFWGVKTAKSEMGLFYVFCVRELSDHLDRAYLVEGTITTCQPKVSLELKERNEYAHHRHLET